MESIFRFGGRDWRSLLPPYSHSGRSVPHLAQRPQRSPHRMRHALARYVFFALVAVAVGGAAGYWLGAGVHTSQHRVLIRRELENLKTITDALEALKSRDEAATVDRKS